MMHSDVSYALVFKSTVMRKLIIALGLLFIVDALSAQDLTRRNTVMVESNFIMSLSLSYDRVVPVNEKMSLMVGADYVMGVGFGYGSHWVAPEMDLLLFGPRNFLETGVQYYYSINPDSEAESNSSPALRIAYRFQGDNRWTLRSTANFIFEIDPIFIPSIGIGYSF